MEDNKPSNSKYIRIGVLVLVLALGGYFGYTKINHAMHYEETDNAQIETHSAPVLVRIAGYVDSVLVTDYTEVKAGQKLLSIDSREYEIAVQQAEADLLQAQADLENAKASVLNSNESIKVSKANAELARIRKDKAAADYERDKNLYADNSITKKQLEDSKANIDALNQSLLTTEAQTKQVSTSLGLNNAQINKAEALVKARQTQLENAKLRLSYASVTASISGKIGKKSVEPGQYVQPGQNLLTIVNDDSYWLVANFKETQIEHMQVGQQVTIVLDAYPDTKIEGEIESLSEATGSKFSLLPPDNATGNFIKVTQRVPVKIAIKNVAAVKSTLRAGLSATVEVKVK